jgi:hypothetical protein
MNNYPILPTRGLLFACAAIIFVASFSLCQAAPIPGINIVIKRNPGGIITRTTSDANGTFTFRSVPPGTYTLTTTEREVSAALTKFAAATPGVTLKLNADGTPNLEGVILKVKVGAGTVREYTLKQACAGIEIAITGTDTTVQDISGEVVDTYQTVNTSRSNIKR